MKRDRGWLVLAIFAACLVAVAPRPLLAATAHGMSLASTRDGLVGEVTIVLDGERFVLEDQVLVITDSATVFSGGISGVADLVPGDLVQVDGSWLEDGSWLASGVARLQGAGDEVMIQGIVAWIDAPDGFVLSDGTAVSVTAETQWIGVGGLSALTAGDMVAVTGVADAWWTTIEATAVHLLGSGEPDTVAFQGVVSEVRPDGVVLEDGSLVLVDGETVYVGFSGLDELVTGAVVGVEAVPLESPGTFRAVTLELLDEPSGSVDILTLVAAVLDDWRFATVDGFTVITDPTTDLDGFDSIGELEPGDTVGVIGAFTEDGAVLASVVTLLEHGGGGGSGLVIDLMGTIATLSPPEEFVLDDGSAIRTTADTAWLGGLTGYGDLEEGMVVAVTAELGEDDTLRALTVERLGATDAGTIDVAGTVVSVPAAGELILDDGSDVLVTGQTVLDGDADGPEDLVPGMSILATCVGRGDGRLEALSLVATAAPSPDDFEGLDEDEASEALVVLARGASAADVASRYGATLEGRLPGRRIVLFRWPVPLPQDLIETLLEDPDVEALEANYRFHDPESTRRRMPIADRSPTSERYVHQPAAGASGIEQAHHAAVGGGTLVAVIDTGVEPFHPLLRHRIAPGGWDFVDGDAEPWETTNGVDDDGDGDVDEAAGHGTFVSGLVLLAAPGTRIVPYRVLDDDGRGSTFAVCEAMIAAMDRGVDVINLSLVYRRRSRVLDRLLDEAIARGVVLVAGTGNDGEDALPFPARDHRVISVAAADDSGAVAPFSNAAPGVTLAAPGESLYSALLDGGFGTWSGTSMAAPLVSGTAAVMRSINHRLTPQEIQAALVQGAAPLQGQSRGVHGLLDAGAALSLVPGGR